MQAKVLEHLSAKFGRKVEKVSVADSHDQRLDKPNVKTADERKEFRKYATQHGDQQPNARGYVHSLTPYIMEGQRLNGSNGCVL